MAAIHMGRFIEFRGIFRSSMRQFGTLRAIFLSFYSRPFYRDAFFRWQGLGFTYLLTVLAILMVPAGISFHYTLNHISLGTDGRHYRLGDLVAEMAEQMPTFTVEKGTLSVEGDMPKRIQHHESGRTLLLLDTGMHAQQRPLKEDDDALLVATKDFLLLRNDGDAVQAIPFSKITDALGLQRGGKYTVTAEQMLSLGNQLRDKAHYAAIWFYAAQTGAIWLNTCIGAFIFSLLGIAISALMKMEIPLRHMVRLASVTATPVVVFQCLSLTFGIQIFSLEAIVYFLMHGAYLHFALDSVRPKTSHVNVSA